jgi:hypothetical protein
MLELRTTQQNLGGGGSQLSRGIPKVEMMVKGAAGLMHTQSSSDLTVNWPQVPAGWALTGVECELNREEKWTGRWTGWVG